MAWVRRVMHRAPVTALSSELVRFDMQALETPEISGVEYQQGRHCNERYRLRARRCVDATVCYRFPEPFFRRFMRIATKRAAGSVPAIAGCCLPTVVSSSDQRSVLLIHVSVQAEVVSACFRICLNNQITH
ncbi:RRXRR domain-containing protein [Paraburkholderia youngii]|uniref:RRXRR domain-containing protein n=1 Tax=Paraburkholderia youngii TaxID=2782701 RepID=A0A7Y6N3I6_9BURK|nr:hypothetical protein [Paraburkholderia youngii]